MDVQDDAKHAMCSETKREDSVQVWRLLPVLKILFDSYGTQQQKKYQNQKTFN